MPVLGPRSGAHVNPAGTPGLTVRRAIGKRAAAGYVGMLVAGAVGGVWTAQVMFDMAVLQLSTTERSGPALWTAEVIATFGLLVVIFGGLRYRAEAVPTLVALYITGAYWFTASTSFANPAVTIARGLSDTFAGIRPDHVPMFIAMQLLGTLIGVVVLGRLFRA